MNRYINLSKFRRRDTLLAKQLNLMQRLLKTFLKRKLFLLIFCFEGQKAGMEETSFQF